MNASPVKSWEPILPNKKIVWHQPSAMCIEQYALLMSSMLHRHNVTVTTSKGVFTGVVNMIEAEDGSGHNFNINISTMQCNQAAFVNLDARVVSA